jgi:5-methylcytosine-specific restriction endonuclease McrBC regulatory subunit McrC
MIPSDPIVCFECGSDEQRLEKTSAKNIGVDLVALERLAAQGLIELNTHGDAVTITGKDRVGMVVLPSGRRLIIRTKIPNVTILEWLVYLGEVPHLTSWLQEAAVSSGDDFYICIAKLFLRELERVTRLHLRMDYVAETTEATLVRGRVVMSRLAYRIHRLPRVPLAYRCRTLDTAYNAVLALALEKLRSSYSEFCQEDRARFATLRDQWASIHREITDPVVAATEAQWACPAGYRIVIQLARLILVGVSLDPCSRMGGQAFTLPLSLIWERSVRKMFFDLGEQTGWIPVSDGRRTRKWDDSYGMEDPSRWLTADVILEQRGARWVLDAKYKRSFGVESRADRFQMCAYALAFNADGGSLVYPTARGDQYRARRLLATTIGAKELVIDSMELPMTSGPAACLNAIQRVCTCRRVGSEFRESSAGVFRMTSSATSPAAR